MTALSASRLTKHKWVGDSKGFLAADSQTFYDGALVMKDSSGLLRPAAALAGNRGCIGVASLTPAGGYSDGSKASGTGGDTWIPVVEGVFSFAGATLEQDDVGKLVYATDDQTVDETPAANLPIAGHLVEYVSASEGYVYASWKRAIQEHHGVYTTHMKLASIADGDLLTTWTPGFAGILTKIEAHVTDPATTGSKASTLNVEIGTTNCTGNLALTSANMTPLGAVVSQALTGGVFFGASDTVSIEAASTTTFVEGEVTLALHFKQIGIG